MNTCLKELFGNKLSSTTIPDDINVESFYWCRKAVIDYAPDSDGAKAYITLTKELLSKLL